MTAEERRKASGPLIGPRPRQRNRGAATVVRRSALRLPLWGAKTFLGSKDLASRPFEASFFESVKEDPDAIRIAGMQFAV